MYNIYLEERSQYVNNVPEKQNETSDENAVLCLKYSYSFLKTKKKTKPEPNYLVLQVSISGTSFYKHLRSIHPFISWK